MSNRQNRTSTRADLGQGPERPAVTTVEPIAVAASVLWLVAVGGALWLGGEGSEGLRPVVVLLVLVLPVAMIWVAVSALRSVRIVREESRHMAIALDAMRQAILSDRQNRAAVSPTTGESAPRPATRSQPAREPAEAPPAKRPVAVIQPVEEQPSLAFAPGPDDAHGPLGTVDLIRALNFPEHDQDTEGFNALRLALRDRKSRKLIQAAQDILTLLSQDGIYTDDLTPDRARPEIWRRFAQGERGRTVAQLGGIHDRSCLGLVMNRMREDTIFRDTAHHFLRLFDRMIADFEPRADDEEIAALADTRTARAFMLLGRVTGAFD